MGRLGFVGALRGAVVCGFGMVISFRGQGRVRTFMPLSGRRSKFIPEEPLKQWALAIPMRLASQVE